MTSKADIEFIAPGKRRSRMIVAIACAAVVLWLVWGRLSPFVTGLERLPTQTVLNNVPATSGAEGGSALTNFDPKDGEPDIFQKIEMAKELDLTAGEALAIIEIRKDGSPQSVEELALQLDRFKKALRPGPYLKIEEQARSIFIKRMRRIRLVMSPEDWELFSAKLKVRASEIGLPFNMDEVLSKAGEPGPSGGPAM